MLNEQAPPLRARGFDGTGRADRAVENTVPCIYDTWRAKVNQFSRKLVSKSRFQVDDFVRMARVWVPGKRDRKLSPAESIEQRIPDPRATSIGKLKNMRRSRYAEPGEAHELTFSCYRRLPLFNDDALKRIFLKSLCIARRKHGFAVWA